MDLSEVKKALKRGLFYYTYLRLCDCAVEDLLTLLDLYACLECVSGNNKVKACNLLAVKRYAALLDETLDLALACCKTASDHKVNDVHAVADSVSFKLCCGHVGVVTGINEDGSIVIREMNYFGPGIISEAIIPAEMVESFNYIY